MKRDKAIEEFLKTNSIKPNDNGFSEQTMKMIAQRKKTAKRHQINWGNVLQYSCYALAGIVLAYFCGKGLLNDILTAPTYRIGFFARILKDWLYIILIGMSLITFTICNLQPRE